MLTELTPLSPILQFVLSSALPNISFFTTTKMSQWDSELACLGSNLDFATPIHTLSCAGHIIFPCLSFLNQKMASQARSKKSVNLPLVILELGGGGGRVASLRPPAPQGLSGLKLRSGFLSAC